MLIFSLEATEKQLSMRMLSAESRVNGACLRSGSIEGEEWERIGKAGDILSKAPMYINASQGISILDIEILAGDIKEETGASRNNHCQKQKRSKGMAALNFSQQYSLFEELRN